MVKLCSAAVCKCNFKNINFPDLYKFAWSDDLVVTAKYNIVKLVFGVYWTLYCLFNMISAMNDDEFRNKHFWFLSNWGLYISTAYLLASAIAGTLQYGHLLSSPGVVPIEDSSDAEVPAAPTAGESASPAAGKQQPPAAAGDAEAPAPADATAAEDDDAPARETTAGSVAVTEAALGTADAPASEQAEPEETDADAPAADATDAAADDGTAADSGAEQTSSDKDSADATADGAVLSGADNDGSAEGDAATAGSAGKQEQVAAQPGATAPQQEPLQPAQSSSAKADEGRSGGECGSAQEEGGEGGVLPLEEPLSEDATWPSCSASCNGRTATQPTVLPTARLYPHCNPTQSFWVHATIVFLFELAFSLGIGITLIYWALLFDPDRNDEVTDLYRSVQTHITLVVPVLECMLSRMPYSASHFPAMVGVGLFYIFVNGMFTAANPGDELYAILTWQSAGSTLAVLIGVLALAIASFWGGRACTRTRDLLSQRYLARARKGVA